MSVGTIAIVVIGLISAVNLLLGVGIIRKLREHSAKFAAAGSMDLYTPVVGAEVDAFEGVTTRGEPIVRETIQPGTLVAFFSPECPPCVEAVPGFVDRFQEDGQIPPLVVISGPEEEARAMATVLEQVAKVVVEPYRGPVARAFGVHSTPTYLLFDSGKIAASEMKLDRVPA
jgi:thiol-disulfide isomerase/thioredoxin